MGLLVQYRIFSMKQTLEIINQMLSDGIVSRYAIGGAVGATFYLEPAATLDVDIFVSMEPVAGSSFITLTPIYDYLSKRGCRVEKEYIILGGWPVQFLPPVDALDEEALALAQEKEVDGLKTWVMTAEHLTAIALRTGRTKDLIRVAQFIEGGNLDVAKLDEILERHALAQKWEKFMQKFRQDNL